MTIKTRYFDCPCCGWGEVAVNYEVETDTFDFNPECGCREYIDRFEKGLDTYDQSLREKFAFELED